MKTLSEKKNLEDLSLFAHLTKHQSTKSKVRSFSMYTTCLIKLFPVQIIWAALLYTTQMLLAKRAQLNASKQNS